MAFKAVLVFCSLAIIQSISGQSCYRPITPSCGCNSDTFSITVSESDYGKNQPVSRRQNRVLVSEDSYQSIAQASSIAIPNNGGAFTVTSLGPISPSGIGVATNLGLSGELVLSGAVPYLSAVAFEGQFDTSGAASVSYECGDVVAINEQIGGVSGVRGVTNNFAGVTNNFGGVASGVGVNAGSLSINVNDCGGQ